MRPNDYITKYVPDGAIVWAGLDPSSSYETYCKIYVYTWRAFDECYIPDECAKYLKRMGLQDYIYRDPHSNGYLKGEYRLMGGYYTSCDRMTYETVYSFNNSTAITFLPDLEEH
jgi:hypothetical protein